MSNEIRLLKAFIDTAGYDVEELSTEMIGQYEYKVTKKKKITKNSPKKGIDNEDFERFWFWYPKRSGSNPKLSALTAWHKRINQGIDPNVMIGGATRYKKFCDATGKTGTEYVMMASSFLNGKEGYLEAWEVTNKLLLPNNSNELMSFATKNNLSQPKVGESMDAYRQRLQREVL